MSFIDKNTFIIAFCRVLRRVIPAKWYLSFRYRLVFKKRLDWKNPQTFSEKLQWLKIYGYKSLYSALVDKVKVKDYVAGKIGTQYIIPTLCTWDNPKEIDISSLPERFVLKCNHGSGDIIVCKDKSSFDIDGAKKQIEKSYRSDYYLRGMEFPYKYVKKKVFAEEYMQQSPGQDLLDYKFFCFNGEPKFFKINFGRFEEFHANYYNLDMELLPFGELDPCPVPSRRFDKPENFDKMVEIARALSAEIPFVRVDLYNIEGKIYFSELTFYPTSGFGPFRPQEWDKKIGDLLTLPPKNS